MAVPAVDPHQRRPHLKHATTALLSVYGTLFLSASMAAARSNDDATTTRTFLDAADHAADQVADPVEAVRHLVEVVLGKVRGALHLLSSECWSQPAIRLLAALGSSAWRSGFWGPIGAAGTGHPSGVTEWPGAVGSGAAARRHPPAWRGRSRRSARPRTR